jgi:hypothetical protein
VKPANPPVYKQPNLTGFNLNRVPTLGIHAPAKLLVLAHERAQAGGACRLSDGTGSQRTSKYRMDSSNDRQN